MKEIRNLSLIVFFLMNFSFAYSQQTAFFGDVAEDLQMARELYHQGKYNAAFRQFEKVQKQVDPKSELYSEALYFMAVSATKAGHTSGYRLLERFIDDYPDSPYLNNALVNLGDYQFEREHYAAVLRTYAEVDRSSLNEEELVKLKYQNGYSSLMTEDIDQALIEFTEIKDRNNFYSRPATYYWAHIMYLQENYQSALDGFRQLESDPAYSRVIPLYVSHIYYKQQRYNDVVNYTVSIIDEVEEEHKSELAKIVGDSYFHLREYAKAIPYLESYYQTSGPKTREDNYLLGYCYYNTAQYEKAIPLLENASKGKDEMAQNAYYHLADSYIKTDEKEKARVAFEAASEFDFNERIKEDALFSYAKLTYELSYSPFNETIKAFDRYITLYPNSQRNSEAYRYLTEVFMVTRNYRDAINSIEKIENKTSEILRAYQRVTFYRGLELFNNLAYNQAIDHFDLSLENGSYDRELNARALYWKAEALYRVGEYRASAETYSQFLRTAGAFSLPEYKDAEYNLAYAYFKQENYNQASSHFRNYINSQQGQQSEKLADAYNRLGDYYFSNAEYSLARQNYQKAFDMKTFDTDYSLYQIAFCQGLQHDQQGKINSLQRLREGFPNSEYVDDALYELGRAYERLGQYTEATRNYRQIVNSHTESTYFPRALLQLGLINYNSGDFTQALTYYKQVAEKFAGTPEAQAALLGIKNSYVEMNNVDGYFAYTRTLGGGVNVTTSEQDSLTYMAAERLYMSGDAQAFGQLQRYLQQFPNGSFATNAHFYLAELLYKEGSFSEANEHYTHVARRPSNIFSEQALSRASELTFNAGNYEEALEFFNRLEKVAGNKWNQLKAYTGQMRCNFQLKRYNEAISSAEKVKKSDVANEAWVREANFVMGKSNYVNGNRNVALGPLKLVAADTKTEQGAEAKYLVAEILYQQNQKQQAEAEIMDFISKGTPFQFWLGKAFLLLSDIYLDRGDSFQAKHTLRSVVENYGADNDGVKAEASRKLAEIEAKEQTEQQQAIDSSFQLKINEN
jgi:TolA-binding protein